VSLFFKPKHVTRVHVTRCFVATARLKPINTSQCKKHMLLLYNVCTRYSMR